MATNAKKAIKAYIRKPSGKAAQRSTSTKKSAAARTTALSYLMYPAKHGGLGDGMAGRTQYDPCPHPHCRMLISSLGLFSDAWNQSPTGSTVPDVDRRPRPSIASRARLSLDHA